MALAGWSSPIRSFHIHRTPTHLLPVYVSGSEAACCSDFLGSCRELTADFLFCKTEIQRVSSQLLPYGGFSPVRLQGRYVRQGPPVRRNPRVDQFAVVLRAPRCPRLIRVLCRGTVRAGAPSFERLLPLYPRGPRSGPGSSVPVHPRLIGLILPRLQAHSDFTAFRLIPDAFAVHTAPMRPSSGSTLSLPFLLDMPSSTTPGRSQPVCSRLRFLLEEHLLPFEPYMRRHPSRISSIRTMPEYHKGCMTPPQRIRGLFLSPGIGRIWFSRARGESRLEARSAEERRISMMQCTMPEERMVISKFNQEQGVRLCGRWERFRR